MSIRMKNVIHQRRGFEFGAEIGRDTSPIRWSEILSGSRFSAASAAGFQRPASKIFFPLWGRAEPDGTIGRREQKTGIQARRPVRNEQNCEQCGPDNPSPLSRRVLGRYAPGTRRASGPVPVIADVDMVAFLSRDKSSPWRFFSAFPNLQTESRREARILRGELCTRRFVG